MIYEKTVDMNPLETAIDELNKKIDDFQQILKKKDLTLLNLFLQGTVIPQVHKGPLSYAEAFLDQRENSKYTTQQTDNFKCVFRFVIFLLDIKIKKKLILNCFFFQGDLLL